MNPQQRVSSQDSMGPLKPSSFHPEETNLVVILPRDIIGRADVNIFWFQGNAELRLNRLGFGDSFILQTTSIEHIKKIGISTGVNLIGSIQFDPTVLEEFYQGSMDDTRTHLGLDIISHGRGVLLSSNRFAHFWSETMKLGMQLIKLTPAFKHASA